MAAVIKPSFTAGELGPALHARVDINKYGIGLKTARNVIVRAEGGVSNRAGTKYVGPVRDHNYENRLIPFAFNTEQNYILEFGQQVVRFIRDGGHIVETGVVITGATAANPVVVTTSGAHGYSNGDEVYITGVVGMTQLNGNRYTIADKGTTTFELTSQVTSVDVNGSAYTAYASAGLSEKIYEIASPYAASDLPVLKFTQSADVMTFTHPNYDTRELTRTAHTAWTFTTPTFAPDTSFPNTIAGSAAVGTAEDYDYQVTAVLEETHEQSLPGTRATEVITAITAANPAVVTINGHSFSNGNEVHIAAVVGMTELNGRRFIVAGKTTNTFQLTDENSSAYTAYSSAGTAGRTGITVASNALSSTNFVTLTWVGITDAEKYDVYRSINGIYGYIGSTPGLTFVDEGFDADLTDTPPAARNPFFGSNNQPGTVTYFEQRRVFASSNNKVDTAWYSQTGNANNLTTSTPAGDADAITATLNARQVNEIRHMVPMNDLLIFTSGGEWRINSGGNGGFAAATLRQKPQSYWGSSHVPPIVIGNTILFVHESGAHIRNLGYKLEADAYTGSNMTILASHLFTAADIVWEWAYAQIPDSIVWVVRSDGLMRSLTFNEEQEVVGWTRHDTLGKYESVAVARENAENEDAVYTVVKRTVNGSTVRMVERMHTRVFEEVEDCFFVDAGLSYDDPVYVSAATKATPVVITATAHGYSNGDLVDFAGFDAGEDSTGAATNMTELNGNRYKVANKATNTFQLTKPSDGSNINGTAFTTYTEGGYVRKAVTTLTGLDHLQGQTVKVLADGNVISGKVVGTVTGGVGITLNTAASRVHIGLGYVSDVETLNVEIPTQEGTIQGKLVRMNSVVVRFQDSRGLRIGPDEDHLVEMKQREFEVMGAPTALLTGDKKIILKSDWNSNGRLFMRQQDPLPLTILAVVSDVRVGG